MTIPSNSAPRRRWKPWVLILVGLMLAGLILAICTGVGVLGYVVVQLRDITGPSDCSDEAYDLVRPVLPASAEVLEEECSSFVNSTYTVIFSMSPDDLSTFQQQHHPQAKIDEWQTDLSDPYLSEESKQAIITRLEEQGAQLNSILYGRYSDGIYWMEILIDTSDPQQYLVYYSNSYVD